MANPVPASMPTRKSVTGFVTKLVGDGATYGFINDEIFFQQTNVTDGPANSGDRVFAECEYSEHLPIKWNATSIKILGRASTGPVAGNILESDPRRQSRQGQMNQAPLAQPPQPQQSTLPPHSVANTYQQHRQQRQSQHETSITQPPPPPPSHLQQPPSQQQPLAMLDQAGLQQQPEYFSPFAQPPPQDLPPFQHDTPMGPPKLEYTSQLGSAFVQNQFLPAPLLPQQAPPQPMLPQHQQTQIQQPQQQQQHQRQQHQPNQRDQRGPRDNNVKGRFNDKNDRNQSNRGKNRNDQPRSNDRESSANARSSRSGNSREHSAGRGDNRPQKRDEPSRQSPLSHSSRNNAGSEKNHKTNLRKHYEPHNVPKAAILTNLNGCNMRARCSSSVHVPSDLKNVIVNKFLRLDIKNTPKPLAFKIEPADEPPKVSEGDDQKAISSATSAEDIKPTVGENEDAASQSSSDNKMSESKNDLQITPPSSRSEHKLNHKYGVKVVLISLPELDDIYKKLFGDHLDSYSNESKSHPKLDEAIAFLCNKGPNGGHSLIGGKFDSNLDGFVEGENNEFENHGRLPDLVATCRRVVLEQTGLDLRPCQGWTLVSTFIYNNRSNYFSSKSSVEYSYIYLPHIWSMPNNHLETSMTDKESLSVNVSNLTQGNMDSDVEVNQDSTLLVESNTSTLNSTIENDTPIIQSEDIIQTPLVTLDNISELKVADLKLELDKRDIKYKPNAKKAELALALQEGLTQPPTESAEEKVTEGDQMKEIDGAEISVEIAAVEENNKSETVGVETDDTNDQSAKRKSDDIQDLNEQETKKVCMDETLEVSPVKKTERVELIKQPFLVKARPGQQQLSTVTLYEAVQVSRYDQFELSVASHILKESLIQHLSEYIFTTLVEDSRQKAKEASDSTSNASSIANSQDTNNSDTNNNNNSTLNMPAPVTGNQASSAIDRVNLVKEYPPDRYINLAFAYFDSTHMGHIQADDLFKLFNNTGLTISKRALWSLIGEGDKFNYRTLPDLSTRFPPNYVYRFPDQFNRLPGSSSSSSSSSSNQLGDGSESQIISTSRMVEYQGVKYDVERLIQQVREAEINQVNTIQRFNDAILKHDQQEAEIHVLEVSQMSLSNSIKALNDEVSELKREKLEVEKRVDSLKKQIKEAIKTLSE